MEKTIAKEIGSPITHKSSCHDILEGIPGFFLYVTLQRYRISIDATSFAWTIIALFSVNIKQFPHFLFHAIKNKFDFSEDPQITYEQAIWCASGMLVIIGLNTILMNQIFITAFHSGMKIRVAVCSAVYRKVRAMAR